MFIASPLSSYGEICEKWRDLEMAPLHLIIQIYRESQSFMAVILHLQF